MFAPGASNAIPDQWLDAFDLVLTSRSDRIYNNGRQQIEVTLVIEPCPGQVITQTQFDSLALVYQTAQGDWATLAQGPDEAAWSYQTEHDARFDYYPSLIDLSVPVRRTPFTRIKRFYIHCTAAPGESLVLAGRLFHTPDTPVFTGQSLPCALIAEPSPTYAVPADYVCQRQVRIDDRLFGQASLASDAFIYEYAVRPRHIDFATAHFASPSAAACNLIRWDDQEPACGQATIVGLVMPHSTHVVYEPAVATMLDRRLATDRLTPGDGQIVVVVQGMTKVPRTLEEGRSPQPVLVEAFDRQGALHRLTIDFQTRTDRFEVCVRNTPSAQAQAISNISYLKVSGRGMVADGTTCRLYSNGVQQTYVTVQAEGVTKEGEIVPIPEEVMNAITLVDYDSGQPLGADYQVTRTRSAMDQRFIYYQNQQRTEDLAPTEARAQSTQFFISTTAQENRRIAAKLVYGGKTYHTHDRTLPAGNGQTIAGRSNCSAMLEPKAPDYLYDRPAFFSFTRYNAGDVRQSGVEDIDRYELRLKETVPHRLCWYNYNMTLFWDYTGDTRSNWIYLCPLTGHRSVTASFRGISQPLSYFDNAVCHYRIKVNKNWSAGESNSNISYRCMPRDDNGNLHSVWVATTERMNQLLI